MPRIRLVGTNNLPGVSGHDGHIIEVTEENQEAAETLVLVGSARTLKEPAEVIAIATGPQLEKLSPDQLPKGVLDASQESKLNRASAVSELSHHGIHGRYIKALTDAGKVTVGDVADVQDKLADIAGISPAAAATIQSVLKELQIEN